jgi:hypothetical protein
MKKPKPRKYRPTPVRLEPQPAWNLGRHIRVTIANGAPVPRFLEAMIVKSTDHKGGSQ